MCHGNGAAIPLTDDYRRLVLTVRKSRPGILVFCAILTSLVGLFYW